MVVAEDISEELSGQIQIINQCLFGVFKPKMVSQKTKLKKEMY